MLAVISCLIRRLMFWTAWGNTPKVEKSTLNGTQRVAMVTSNITWPDGITLDRQNKLVFWVDERTNAVESVDYDGNNRTLLLRQPGTPFIGVTFILSYLYVIEWGRNWVYKVDASNGSVESILTFGFGQTMGLVAYDSSLVSPGLQYNNTSLLHPFCNHCSHFNLV